MALSIHNQLDQFVSDFISLHQTGDKELLTEYDSQWLSPCYLASANEGDLVRWLPCRQRDNHSFDNVETALNISLNPEYCEFFTRYYSNNLPAVAKQGQCELLQVWNSDDFERLQQNLIGHLLMKQRLKQTPTLFFALTNEEDFILSVQNDTGEVVLEQVGRPPQEIIAPNLSAFIASLNPQ